MSEATPGEGLRPPAAGRPPPTSSQFAGSETVSLGQGGREGGAGDEPERAGRYLLREEIGRGGMGVVLRAIDPDIQRPLAVKIMLGDAGLVAEHRFDQEARLTGQLQHPGVPPVHELGRLDDGRPFFAMKLIEGRTLAEMLAERPDPCHELARFIGIFGQICQTLAYAHSRQVIHRDLKPHNIMVGAFGEVQVMDWGLAKLLPAPGQEQTLAPPPGSPEGDASPALSGDSLSRSGQIIGTPAYLAPEQAQGRIENVTERSDVFGLGAILCVILTGKPPFVASSPLEQLSLASRGEVQDAIRRLDACGADAELVGLARHCLAPDPDHRPKDAGEVARAVADYQTGAEERLRQAEMARHEAEIQTREERKRRRVWLALAGAILVLFAAAGLAGLWFVHDQTLREADLRDRRTQVNREIPAALAEGTRLLDELKGRISSPAGVHVLLSNLPEWRRILDRVEERQKQARTIAHGNEALLEHGLAELLDSLDSRLVQENDAYRLTEELDMIRLNMVKLVDGKWLPTHAISAYEKFFDRFGFDWQDAKHGAGRVRGSPIRFVIVAALDQWSDLISVSKEWLTSPKLSYLLAVCREADPDAWRDHYRRVETWRDLKELKRLADEVKLAEQAPHTLVGLALRLNSLGVDTAPLLGAALVHHPRDFWLHFNLGNMLAPTERTRSAAHYQAAIAIRPQNAVAHHNLGYVLHKHKDLRAAGDAYERAVALDPQNAEGFSNLGRVRFDQKNFAAARIAGQKSVDLDPLSPTYVNDLGTILIQLDDLAGAEKAFNKAIELDKNHARAHHNLGNVRLAQNDLDGAIALYETALKLEPENARACSHMGLALARKNKIREAIDCYLKSIKYNDRDAFTYNQLGHALAAQKDMKGALAAYRKAVEVDELYAPAFHSLGIALARQGQLTAALDIFKKAVVLEPKAFAFTNLGNTHALLKDYAAAADSYRKAIATDETHAEAHFKLAIALRRQGEFTAALESARRSQKHGAPHAAALLDEFEPLPALSRNEPLMPVDDKVIRSGIRGVLGKQDSLDIFIRNNRGFRQGHVVSLKGGQPYQIDLEGTFDTLLRVEDAFFTPLVFNDDVTPTQSPHSRLVFIPPANGLYRLVCTSAEAGATGSYTLKMKEAVRIGPARSTKGELKPKGLKGKATVNYKFSLTAGRPVVIELESQAFDTYLAVTDAGSATPIVENDDHVPGHQHFSRIDFTPHRTGVHTVIVTSFRAGQGGAYTLTVQEFK